MSPRTKFSDYYRSLPRKEREAFAARAETSSRYIEIHLLRAKKIARSDTIRRLAAASQGAVTEREVLDHFYQGLAA